MIVTLAAHVALLLVLVAVTGLLTALGVTDRIGDLLLRGGEK